MVYFNYRQRRSLIGEGAFSTYSERMEKSMGEIVNVAEIFGENVFNDAVMRERLPKSVYKKLKKNHCRGQGAGSGHRGFCGSGHEGVGGRAGRYPLHPLVPASDRGNGGKA